MTTEIAASGLPAQVRDRSDLRYSIPRHSGFHGGSMGEAGRQVRVFVSSPGDARFERSRLDRVVERLNGEFQGAARLLSIRWETEFYKAHDTFQAQIPESAQCDIVVAIFRGRLGTELPANFPPMSDGRPYPSGTAYEVLSAIEASKGRGFPDVYVFRFPQPPSVQLDDPERPETEAQWEHLKAFFESWFKTPEGQFKAAFQTFASTDDFEAQAESLLRKWLEEKVLHGRSVAWPVGVKGSPFRGLASFGAKHASVFFGRSRDIAKATDRLKDAAEKGCPFLLVDGPSGSGKSSLARAGLVPRLTASGVVPRIDLWRVAVMRPGELAGDPFAALARAFFVRAEDLPDAEQGRPPALPELNASDFKNPEELTALLTHADNVALKPIVGTLAAIEHSVRKRDSYDRKVTAALLLVVDQLDELFGAQIGEDVRARFAKLLGLFARSGRVWIIATLRADLFDRFLSQPVLKQLKEDGASYDLAPPGTAELAEIVRGPAAAADLIYETDSATGERLDERLLKDADRPDLLPLLQFTLNQLFEASETSNCEVQLTFAAYRALGGLEGAVDKEAEAALRALGEAERARLPRLLRELAAPARNGAASVGRVGYDIRSVPLADAAHDEPSANLVHALVDARILLSVADGSQATVRLAHARVLDSWQRAKAIVVENADFYRVRAEVEGQRGRWKASRQKPELLLPSGLPLAEAESINARYGDELGAETRAFVVASGRRARRKQRLVAAAAVVFGLLAVSAAGAAWLAWRNEARASRNLNLAISQGDALVSKISSELKDFTGLSKEAIRRVLLVIEDKFDEIAKIDPANAHLVLSRATMLSVVADNYIELGDFSEAARHAEQCAHIARAVLDKAPSYVPAISRLGNCLQRLGLALVSRSDFNAAVRAYLEAIELHRRALSLGGNNPNALDELARALNLYGSALVKMQMFAEARDAAKESLAIAARLVEIDENNPTWQRENVDSRNIVSIALYRLGQTDEALAGFIELLALARKLAKTDQHNALWQRYLSNIVGNVGYVMLALDRRAEGIAALSESADLKRQLVAMDRSNATWQEEFINSLYTLGEGLVSMGRRNDGLVVFRDMVVAARADAQRDSESVMRQFRLIVCLWRLAVEENAAGNAVAASKLAREALTTFGGVDSGKLDDGQQRRLRKMQGDLSSLIPAP